MGFPRAGEVWFIELDESRGHEQSGTRPAVVLARSFGMHTAIPFTTSENAARFPHTHMVDPDAKNGLSEVSFALCFQVLSLDEERFLEKTGELSEYFNQEKYSQRNMVETVFSIIKRRYGDTVRSRKYYNQIKEIKIRMILHNLTL